MSNTGVSKFIQISGLLLLLVILPLVSWYYLSRGYDYQLQARSELNDYGQWTIKNSGLDTLENTVVFALLNQSSSQDSLFYSTLVKLVEQFGERPDFLIGLITSSDDKVNLEPWSDLNLIFIDQNDFQSDEVLLDSKLYLADRKGTIRNSYDYHQITEIKRMVEHIALILPQQPSSDIIYVPEKEK